MRRFCLTLLIVSCLAGLFSRCELEVRQVAQGQGGAESFGYGSATLGTARSSVGDWIRTRDGWERRHVLDPAPSSNPWPLPHPGIIAALQLGLSSLALMAFPSRARVLAGETATAKTQAARHEKRRGLVTRQGATAS
ncbi:MAG: hypothetical protein RH917_18640 [Lacipirellulaceae bacterium]